MINAAEFVDRDSTVDGADGGLHGIGGAAGSLW